MIYMYMKYISPKFSYTCFYYMYFNSTLTFYFAFISFFLASAILYWNVYVFGVNIKYFINYIQKTVYQFKCMPF